MNILDENIDFFTRQQLAQWKFHFRQIGLEIGHSGMKDFDEIIPLLHSLRRPTLLTRDDDFIIRNCATPIIAWHILR